MARVIRHATHSEGQAFPDGFSSLEVGRPVDVVKSLPLKLRPKIVRSFKNFQSKLARSSDGWKMNFFCEKCFLMAL